MCQYECNSIIMSARPKTESKCFCSKCYAEKQEAIDGTLPETKDQQLLRRAEVFGVIGIEQRGMYEHFEILLSQIFHRRVWKRFE